MEKLCVWQLIEFCGDMASGHPNHWDRMFDSKIHEEYFLDFYCFFSIAMSVCFAAKNVCFIPFAYGNPQLLWNKWISVKQRALCFTEMAFVSQQLEIFEKTVKTKKSNLFNYFPKQGDLNCLHFQFSICQPYFVGKWDLRDSFIHKQR